MFCCTTPSPHCQCLLPSQSIFNLLRTHHVPTTHLDRSSAPQLLLGCLAAPPILIGLSHLLPLSHLRSPCLTLSTTTHSSLPSLLCRVSDSFDRRILTTYLDEFLGDFLFDAFQPFHFYVSKVRLQPVLLQPAPSLTLALHRCQAACISMIRHQVLLQIVAWIAACVTYSRKAAFYDAPIVPALRPKLTLKTAP